MASTDFTVMTNSLNISTVDRGVTYGIARPNGGGNFIYGFNSLVVSTGSVALFTNQTNFAPMAKGCSISAAIQRGVSGGPEGFAPFIFASAQGSSVNDNAYILGLGDDDPHHIVLKKGVISTNLQDLAPDAPNNGILLRSTDSYDPGTWLHIRLDVIVNTNGDVLLQCFENDLGSNPVTGAIFTPISGMTQFIDDALQIATGSAPYTSGRAGYGFYTEDVTRRGFFDHITIARQL